MNWSWQVTGQKTVAAAWQTLVKPDRSHRHQSLHGRRPEFSTHSAIVEAVVRGLEEAGVPMSQVVIWDRGDPAAAGFRQVRGGPALRCIEPVYGYDPKAVVESPIAGRLIWGDLAFAPAPARSAGPARARADFRASATGASSSAG